MLSLALYKPFGIAGVVIGTAVSNAVMTAQQIYFLRRELHGFEIARTIRAFATMVGAAAAFGVAAYLGWSLLDDLLGRALIAQIVSVGAALVGGFATYLGLTLLARIPEAQNLARRVSRST